MATVVFDTPAVYGDHHVIEVRRILLEMPGILDVYASSCFHVIEISFDPALISSEGITDRLSAAGYLDPLPVQSEAGVYSPHNMVGARSSRHTSTHEGGKPTVSFSQDLPHAPRTGWPCPGMGLLNFPEDDRHA